jgi:S1-C subfamily serine protease
VTELGLPPVPGLLAVGAFPGTPAEAAGFDGQPALVVAIDGRPTDAGLPSYCDVVADHRQGDTAVFRVVRPGAREPVDVRLAFE